MKTSNVFNNFFIALSFFFLGGGWGGYNSVDAQANCDLGVSYCYTNKPINGNQIWTTAGVIGGPPHPAGCNPAYITVKKRLFIIPGASLTIGPGVVVAFGPDGLVDVLRSTSAGSGTGGVLIVDGGTLTGVSTCMWKGVQIRGYITVDQSTAVPYSRHGRIDIKNSGFIEHAHIGVLLGCITGPSCSNTASGGIIIANNTDAGAIFPNAVFHNNNIGIRFNPYTYPSASKIVKSTFICTGALRDPVYTTTANPSGRSAEFIKILAINGVLIDNNNLFRNIGIDSETNQTYAITSINSSYNVNDCIFRDVYWGITSLYTSTILSSNHTFAGNMMSGLGGSGWGIGIQGGMNDDILNNDITDFTFKAAINMVNSQAFDIFNNTLQNQFSGIAVQNSVQGSRICKNTFDYQTIELAVMGNNTLLKVTCNEFSNYTSRAMLLGTSVTPATVPSEWGNCALQIPAGNIFNNPGSATDIDATFCNPFDYATSVPINTVGGVNQCIVGTSESTFCPPYQCSSTPLGVIVQNYLNETDTFAKGILLSELLRYYAHNNMKQDAINTLDTLNDVEAHRLLAATFIEDGNIAAAQNKLSLIPTGDDEGYNFVKYHTVLLTLKQQGKTLFEIDSAQQQTVREVVATCTRVATSAKALLTLIFNEPVDFETDTTQCSGSSAKMAAGIKDKMIFDADISSIVPNPASENITISYQLPAGSHSGIINFYNTLGKLVLSLPIKDNHGMMDVDTRSMNKGVYFYTLIVNNNAIANKKLVIIR